MLLPTSTGEKCVVLHGEKFPSLDRVGRLDCSFLHSHSLCLSSLSTRSVQQNSSQMQEGYVSVRAFGWQVSCPDLRQEQ